MKLTDAEIARMQRQSCAGKTNFERLVHIVRCLVKGIPPDDCQCGFSGDPIRQCTCSSGTVERYQRKISGPLLDRVDIHVQVPRVEIEKLSDKRQGESSAEIRTPVMAARKRQADRFVQTSLLTNADMGPRELASNVSLDETSEAILKRAVQQLQLSARAYHRVLKLSRTIADLPGDERTQAAQIAEALQYRPRQLPS